ncbi:DUF6907 domain-containing protein [Streptomyces scabiei]
MSREPLNDEQAAAQRSVDRAFPAVARFLATADARPDAHLMRADAPQASTPRTLTLPLLDVPGAVLTVSCPGWCTVDHRRDIEQGVFAADLTHYGAPVDFPALDDRGVPVLRMRLMQTPFSSGERQPVVVLDEPEEEMTPGRVCAFAHQLRVYADALDELAVDLDGARREFEQGCRADHEGRLAK